MRHGKREARLILTHPEDAERPFDLSVEVDRGTATYVHPLPEASADDFVNDDFAGWGEAQNPKSSPAYVEVAATPSATMTVKQGEEKVGEVKWGDVEEKKVVEFTSLFSMTTRASPSLAASISARRRGFPISLTGITIRSIPISIAGMLTLVEILGLDKSLMRISTVVARGGCRAVRSLWMSPGDLSMSRCGRG